jgi:hypothetical protein
VGVIVGRFSCSPVLFFLFFLISAVAAAGPLAAVILAVVVDLVERSLLVGVVCIATDVEVRRRKWWGGRAFCYRSVDFMCLEWRRRVVRLWFNVPDFLWRSGLQCSCFESECVALWFIQMSEYLAFAVVLSGPGLLGGGAIYLAARASSGGEQCGCGSMSLIFFGAPVYSVPVLKVNALRYGLFKCLCA